MKKLVVFLIVSISISAAAFAQKKFENNPKVMELRKAFYNKELLFTDAESKAFWPLFKQFQAEEKSLKKQYRSSKPTKIGTDEDAEKHIQKSFEFDQKKAALKKKYFEKYSKVLPVKKVAQLDATERKFKKEVLKKVRENRKKRNK